MMTTDFDSENARWDAVRRRLRPADGRFVFAVRTTGIYCRPHCPSRAPRRENVRFFEGPADAERAGFRACKRCAPADSPAEDPLTAAVARACARLRSDAERIPLADLARAEGFSASHFQRAFTRIVGISPRAFAAAERAERFRASLPGARSVTEAALDAGYGSAATAFAAAPAALGMTPAQYRRGAPGERIVFGIAACRYGHALVAATARGVCGVALGDAEVDLELDLARRFPRADRVRDDAAVARELAAVVALAERPGDAFAFPLDARGTPFQCRVWGALRAVPAGATTTYAALAAASGRPGAVRAAASACAANPVALAIPCHRAVRTDGGLGGYRWGIERKRELLASERERRHERDESA